MGHEEFWQLIDSARAAPAPTSAALGQSLAALSPGKVRAFQGWLWAYKLAVHREDLWAAVYAIRCGCSDDSFLDFCGWLIAQGQAAVRSAVADPEALVDLIGTTDPRDEHMLNVASLAYRRAFDDELPDEDLAERYAIPELAAWPPDRLTPGLEWNHELYQRVFPRLYERYVSKWERLPPPAGSVAEVRFWALIDEARPGTPTVDAAVERLELVLQGLDQPELVGFFRWLIAYRNALSRPDTHDVGRLLFGSIDDRIAANLSDEVRPVLGLIAWAIMQGAPTVRALAHDAGRVLEGVSHPPSRSHRLFLMCIQLAKTRGVDWLRLEPEPIADLATWSTPDPVLPAFMRFPQLAPLPDDPEAAALVLQQRAVTLVQHASAAALDFDKLRCLDLALELAPHSEPARRARLLVLARLGRTSLALADLDALLADHPSDDATRWQRAQLRDVAGDSAGAIADARTVATRVDAARAWLSARVVNAPTLTRVHHLKFGLGTVVATDASGSEPRLVVDFAAGRKTIAAWFVDPADDSDSPG